MVSSIEKRRSLGMSGTHIIDGYALQLERILTEEESVTEIAVSA